MNKVNAFIKGLVVEWVGMSKGYTDKESKKVTPPSPSIQFKAKDDEGKSEIITAKRKDNVEPKVGEVVDAEFRISAFQGGLYFDLVAVTNGSMPSKPIKV